MTDRLQAGHLLAEPKTRRIVNQAIFAHIWIDTEQVTARTIRSFRRPAAGRRR